MAQHSVFVGCAGWTVPREHAGRFPPAGSHLERYGQRFPAVEINSSFYRPHRPATYARWADAVPEGFRFSVKIPREITHLRRLVGVEEALGRFLSETAALGEKRGPLLVQLPPSLAFTQAAASAFFALLRGQFAGSVVCEPRHAGWFGPDADGLLDEFRVGRVAADPAPVPQASLPGGWGGLVYYRWHGSPRLYYSAYASQALMALAEKLKLTSQSVPVWCIFDNTALGAAADNALQVMARLREQAR